MIKKYVFIISACTLLFSCKQEQTPPEEPADFCSYINDGNIDLTLPIINDFLSGLSNDLNENQRIEKLFLWLKSCPCVTDLFITYTWCDLPTVKIYIKFDENGVTKERYLEVSKSNPWKAIGYSENLIWDKLTCGCWENWMQEESSCLKELVWDYPLKPGMEEWKTFRTTQEAADALQIPEELLFSLSTEDLTAICLQYPFFLMLRETDLYGSPDLVIELLSDFFNGIKELLNREDALKELLKQYRCMMKQLLDKTISDNEKLSLWARRFCPLEILLVHFVSHDNEDNIKILQHLVCGAETGSKTGLVGSPSSYNECARANIINKIDEHYLDEIPLHEKYLILKHGGSSECSAKLINEITCQLTQLKK